MTPGLSQSRSRIAAIIAWACLLSPTLATRAAVTNLYSTQFESAQGYNAALDLAGQNGWIKYGTGGNGLISGFITGAVQHAYIGYEAPAKNDTALFLLRPVDFSPLATGLPIVRFSTQLQFVKSTRGDDDFFQWSVYNIEGDRLFTIDFDSFSTNVSYTLDGTNSYVTTGVRFKHDTTLTLAVTMNFASNLWSATLNSQSLGPGRPITTTAKPLTLGDVDAVWVIYDPVRPGNNYMVFDNYTISAESLPGTPAGRPRLTLLGMAGGQPVMRLNGDNGTRFAIEGTTNFTHWTALKTNLVVDGAFDFADSTAPGLNRRYYRARWVP
jgi:hypothetical protein